MIPVFDPIGNLPVGVHRASWNDFCRRFGHSKHRKKLLDGLETALKALAVAGCKTVYINGISEVPLLYPHKFLQETYL